MFASNLLQVGFVNNAYERVCIPISQLKKKKWSFHMISQIHLIFEEMCFDRFLHFIFHRFPSFISVRVLWLWLSRGGTQSCGRPPLQRMVCFMQCVCIHVDVILLTHSSFSFPFYFIIYSSYTQFSSIGIYTTIYL